ncbi:MAG: sulfatase-like hydrolase/transferase [Pseudomonadales bacterium]
MAQPNILFIITDQQRADHTGFGGNPVVKTPHLDAIAATGVHYEHAYVANSICTPNRCSIITGRVPSAHGAATNGISLDWYANTFVRRLKEAGYKTGIVGKAHLQDWGDLPPPFENEVLLPASRRSSINEYPPEWNTLEQRARHRRERVEFPDDFYGFSHADLVVGHSDCCTGHYEHWLKDKGFDPADLLGVMRPDSPSLATYDKWWQVRKPRLPEELYPSRYIAEKSIDYVKAQAAAENPFFLQVSFPDPHHPFTPPGQYWDRYRPEDMPLPATYSDRHESSTWLARAHANRRGNPEQPVLPFGPDEDQLRHALAAQYGMITLIDDCIGDIVQALDELDLRKDTIIVFTSDHGDMFGDHHIMLKGTLHYAGCIKVPLVIADPSRSGSGNCEALVGSIDIAQTILELAGAAPYDGMQGKSLMPTLDDTNAAVHEALLIEDDYPNDILGTGMPTRMRTVVTKEARLTRYLGSDMGEFFDLAHDPHEMSNHFAENTPAKQAMADTLIDLMTIVSR